MKAKERLYVTADRSKVVKEGDPNAAFLLVGKGQEIHPKLAETYGLKESAPKKKKAEQPEDKQAKAPENKSGSGLKINRLKDKENIDG
jgi:hypothetical protein